MVKVVIVGGVAGGSTAATRLRRLDETAQIIVIERGAYVSFANCGLPYHVGEVIKQREALFVATPESLRADYDLDVRVRQEVAAIDRAQKQVTVRKLDTGETYTESYDKLILSPGARPVTPPVPGADAPGVFTLRSVPDMDAIKTQIDSGQAHSAVVVGGGFIGLEMVENLMARGVEVTLVEMLDQVLMPLDFEMAALVHRHLREHNVRVALGDGLKAIAQKEHGRLEVTLASGKTVETDMVVMAVGVRPENDLAKAAGLELGPRGHIVVNEQLQTSDPDIYAVGDAILSYDSVSCKPTAIPLAGPANRQGRMVANHIAGRPIRYPGTQGTSITKVFDLAVATTGLNAKQLKQLEMPFRSTITHSMSHASYYPGATLISLKVLYAPDTGRLLGAQAVGMNGVPGAVNVLAAAVKAGMSVFDLEELELAYAPPFGAAKDPANMAGFVGSNWLRGDVEVVHWDEVKGLDPQKDLLLDVRTKPEWDVGYIPGTVHIPLQELRQRLAELPKDKRIVVYCKVGQRGYVAARILKAHGYHAVNLTGGMDTWQAATEKQSNFDAWQPKGAAGPAGAGAPAALTPAEVSAAVLVDACGLQCPGPIMQVYRTMQALQPGQVMKAVATDPGFARDIGSWCQSTGNELLEVKQEGAQFVAFVRKAGKPEGAPAVSKAAAAGPGERTLIVFSNDMDRALAAFILANGAAATGQKVTMFFTFWGLNLLRKPQAVAVKKNLIEKMFGLMMPRGAEATKLSKLNMLGAGTAMMKGVMRSKNIDSLPALMRSAQELGVRLIACQMTMDMMGIKPEELIEGIEIGGVATYTAVSDTAGVNLFV